MLDTLGRIGSGMIPELTLADGSRHVELDSSHDARRGNEMQAPAKARGNASSRPIGKGSVRSTWSEGMSNRKPISKRQRWQILERDGHRCRYCGRDADEVKLEIDHLKPVAGGGCNCQSNLVTTCYDCNRGKGVSITGALESRNKRDAYERLRNMTLIAGAEEGAMRMYFRDETLNLKALFLAAYLGGYDSSAVFDFMHESDPGDEDAKKHIVDWLEEEALKYIAQVEIPS